MTLRLRINLIVGALTLLFLALVLGLQWRNQRDSVREEVVAANRVASQLLNRTVATRTAQGPQGMLAFLEGTGRIRANDVLLFDAQGRELYRSPQATYKAGREAPAWFATLIAPPLVEQAITFPEGRLVLRANASRAVLDAWDDVALQASAGLGILLLMNVAVFWLVGRATRPLSQVVNALDALQQGRFDVALPPLPGREAAALGSAFNRMVVAVEHNMTNERRAARAEAQLSDSRDLARWLDQQIEDERRLIARELHDEFGQSVTAMRSMALSIAQRVATLDPTAERAARTIADESSRLYDAMHGVIPRLTPLVLDSLGLGDALLELVNTTRQAHPDVTIRLSFAVNDVALTSDGALALYRAAQEGLSNALRHGAARHVDVDVAGVGGSQVELSVTDDGRGMKSPATASEVGHYGLRWLGERVLALGGEFEATSMPQGGVVLRARVPSKPVAPASTRSTA